jgi:hypothetical protein
LVVDKLRIWLTEQQCIPNGLLYKKMLYVSSRWQALTLFLDDPRIPLDNNRTEGAYIGLSV